MRLPVIGASLSFSFLELRAADEVRVVATPEMGIRVEHPNSPVVERIQTETVRYFVAADWTRSRAERKTAILSFTLIDSDGENWLLTIPESAGSVRSLGLLGAEIESLQNRYEEAQGRLERDRGERRSYGSVTVWPHPVDPGVLGAAIN